MESLSAYSVSDSSVNVPQHRDFEKCMGSLIPPNERRETRPTA